MATKIQRIVVEFQCVFEDVEERPLEGAELLEYIGEDAHLGNFIIRQSVVEDYKGTDDRDYKPLV